MPTDHRMTLTRLGLTECEATTYLALLALGAQSVHVLARETKISRTASYEVLESLEKRGLVVKKTQGSKWIFLAEDPERLESYFGQRLRLFESELETLKRITPELRVHQGAHSATPRVRMLRGYEGLADIFTDVERVAPEEICEFIDTEYLKKECNALDMDKVRELRKVINYHRTRVKFLYRGNDFIPTLSHVAYRKIASLKGFRGNFWIYANRVVFLHYEAGIEIVVVDHHIFAETMRACFSLAWECAEPVAPKV